MNSIYLTREEIEHPYADLKTMIEDKRRKAEQMSKTIFHQITASPEVLALELVTLDCDGWWAYVGIGKRKTYRTREEAIAATVKALKEVAG